MAWPEVTGHRGCKGGEVGPQELEVPRGDGNIFANRHKEIPGFGMEGDREERGRETDGSRSGVAEKGAVGVGDRVEEGVPMIIMAAESKVVFSSLPSWKILGRTCSQMPHGRRTRDRGSMLV